MEISIINLINQLYNKKYKPLSFGVFNFIEEDGFITELSAITKKLYDIEDFEYIIFDIDEQLKTGIKFSKSNVYADIDKFKCELKKLFGNESLKIKIYPIKESGFLIAVKLKEFEIINPEN